MSQTRSLYMTLVRCSCKFLTFRSCVLLNIYISKLRQTKNLGYRPRLPGTTLSLHKLHISWVKFVLLVVNIVWFCCLFEWFCSEFKVVLYQLSSKSAVSPFLGGRISTFANKLKLGPGKWCITEKSSFFTFFPSSSTYKWIQFFYIKHIQMQMHTYI